MNSCCTIPALCGTEIEDNRDAILYFEKYYVKNEFTMSPSSIFTAEYLRMLLQQHKLKSDIKLSNKCQT